MRSQLLRVLQRVPTGAAVAPESFVALRACFSTGVVPSNGSSGVFSTKAQSSREFPEFQRPASLGFAAQMHGLSRDDEEKAAAGSQTVSAAALAGKEALPAHAAITMLPARPSTSSKFMRKPAAPLARVGAALSTAAHSEDHGDHGHSALLNPVAKIHPYHVLPGSWWPLLASYGAMLSVLGMTLWFHAIPHGQSLMFMGVGSTMATAICWWRDCIIESDMGMHTEVVKKNLISGMWLFIVSEAMLFVGLLWTCIHYGMAPNINVHMQWPPVGIVPVGWDKRALVMSAVLAASYYSANIAMVATQQKHVMMALGTTIGLGALFLVDQYLEFNELPFTITDGTYGSTFYITTGFHGMHVLLGTIYLAAVMAMYPRVKVAGVGMKQAVLYWHFVDVVWIFVYGIIYAGGY